MAWKKGDRVAIDLIKIGGQWSRTQTGTIACAYNDSLTVQWDHLPEGDRRYLSMGGALYRGLRYEFACHCGNGRSPDDYLCEACRLKRLTA